MAALICQTKEQPGSMHWRHGPGPIYPAGWEACTKVFRAYQDAWAEDEVAKEKRLKDQPEAEQKAFVEDVAKTLK